MSPEVCRLDKHGNINPKGNIRVTINWKDHVPPHFHVAVKGKGAASVEIESLEISKGWLPDTERRVVIDWAAENQDELYVKWEMALRHIHPGRFT